MNQTNKVDDNALVADEISSPSAKSQKSATAFRTISEVADELDVQQHVLRFWETKFTQIKPLKRGGGRRYYRPEDVLLLKKIHNLLYTEGYTIKGVQKLLREQGKAVLLKEETAFIKPVAPAPQDAVPKMTTAAAAPALSAGLSSRQKAILESMLGELKDLRTMVKSASEQ